MPVDNHLSQLAQEFAVLADGEYGLKSHIQSAKDGIAVLFHAGGYVEFSANKILAVLDVERCVVWELYPGDFRNTIVRFREFLK